MITRMLFSTEFTMRSIICSKVFNVIVGFLIYTMMIMAVKCDVSTESSSLTTPNQSSEGETQRCYDIYGCYSIIGPWRVGNRPVSLFPDPIEMINVKYPIFTRRNLKLPIIIEPSDFGRLRSIKLNSKGPVYIICHGFSQSGDKLWIERMMKALLLQEGNKEAIVIVVDWRIGAQSPYTQAVANVRLVGTITGHFIYHLYKHLQLPNLDNVHFIGHSLGAHAGGYAGSTLQTKFGLTLGRITGMDPAGPHFGNVGNIVRLDKNDAKFVDIIHSDALPFTVLGLGILESIGHVDFWPNGGKNQPGCPQSMFSITTTNDRESFLNCDHDRSYDYFIESITPSCPFMAIRCLSYEKFLNGSCIKCNENNHFCLPFGYHSQRGYNKIVESGRAVMPMNFFLMTSDKYPFCRFHYRVTFRLSLSKENSEQDGEVGKLSITMMGANGTKSEKIPLDEKEGKYHEPGSTRSVVISAQNIGSSPHSVILEWEYETSFLNTLSWRILMSPRIYVSWVRVDSLEYGSSSTFCPLLNSPVEANKPNHFQTQNCNINMDKR